MTACQSIRQCCIWSKSGSIPEHNDGTLGCFKTCVTTWWLSHWQHSKTLNAFKLIAYKMSCLPRDQCALTFEITTLHWKSGVENHNQFIGSTAGLDQSLTAMSDVNFNIPLRARRYYRDVCPTWSLCDRRFPQIQQFYLQSRSYFPYSYPDVNQSSPWAIRTLYPSIVPCKIMEEDQIGFATKGWL